MKIEKNILIPTSVRKAYVPAFFHRNAVRERIQRCYKTDAEIAAEKAQEFIDKVKTEVATDLKAFKANLVEVKALDELKSKLTALEGKSADIKENAEYKSLLSAVDTLILDMKAFKEAKVGNDLSIKKGSIGEMLAKNKAKIDSFVSAKSGTLSLEYKATENSDDIDGRDAFNTWHEGGAVGHLPVRQPFMREMFKNAGTDKEYIKYLDQETAIRDAKNVAGCGTTTSTTKTTFKVREVKVDKVRDFMDVCIDSLDDYPFLNSEINRLLNESLQLKISDQLLLGTGVSPYLHSVDEIASTFDAANSEADYAGLVPFAQLIDLISVAAAQIRALAKGSMAKSQWRPNYVLLNPKDLQLMKFLKDSNQNYIKTNANFPTLFVNNSGQCFIDGMMLVDNPEVPENEFYIGDFTKGTVYARPGVGIEFAYENRSNFETELVTVKVYERLNLLVRNVDANAFMHVPDIQAGITAINKGGIS